MKIGDYRIFWEEKNGLLGVTSPGESEAVVTDDYKLKIKNKKILTSYITRWDGKTYIKLKDIKVKAKI